MLTSWLLLLCVQVEEPGPVTAPLVDAKEAARLAASDSVDQQRPITLLVPLQRADPVSSATSVERTFGRGQEVELESVSTSRAVFVTGPAYLVHEAERRLRALDDATPEPPPRPLRRTPDPSEPQASEEIGVSWSLITLLLFVFAFISVVVSRFIGPR